MTSKENRSKPLASREPMYVSIVCAIRTGPVSAASELMVMAITATMMWGFSSATSGTNRLIPLRSDTGPRLLGPVSSLYFIVAGAALGVEELDIFRRCLHQFLMFSRRQDLSLHQKDDLVVIDYGRDLLRHRDKRNPRIILAHVLQNDALRGGIHARGEIIQQQHFGIERQSPGQHDALLLSAGKAGPALGNHCVQSLRKGRDEILKLRRGNRPFEVSFMDRAAERDVLPQRE